MDIVIYGAQGIALGAYKAIKEIAPEKNVLCFLVTKRVNSASTLDGLSVRELEEFVSSLDAQNKESIEVLIGTPESVMEDIEKSLDAAGLSNHQRLDSMRWADMMEKAFHINKRFIPLSDYECGTETANINVYMAKFWKDKVLESKEVVPTYMIPIQVGTALTDQRVAEVCDDVGENISVKNVNYSELTALYWMWKNWLLSNSEDCDSYYGLAHYRRYLQLSDDDLRRLKHNNIDVVLPYPMPYEPNIEAHHERYLDITEWAAVLQTLEELQPEHAVGLKDILRQGYMYNYNIIVAKRNVLADYCAWLFPILFRIEEIVDPDGTKKPNRYIGYIGETLETLYFMHNKQHLQIAHAGCKFLV